MKGNYEGIQADLDIIMAAAREYGVSGLIALAMCAAVSLCMMIASMKVICAKKALLIFGTIRIVFPIIGILHISFLQAPVQIVFMESYVEAAAGRIIILLMGNCMNLRLVQESGATMLINNFARINVFCNGIEMFRCNGIMKLFPD